MEKKLSTNSKNSLSNESGYNKGMEIHSNKIMPHLEKRNMRRYSKENEWEQEYYIIYNSYVLEDKESES